jgi:hypothetical protein
VLEAQGPVGLDPEREADSLAGRCPGERDFLAGHPVTELYRAPSSEPAGGLQQQAIATELQSDCPMFVRQALSAGPVPDPKETRLPGAPTRRPEIAQFQIPSRRVFEGPDGPVEIRPTGEEAMPVVGAIGGPRRNGDRRSPRGLFHTAESCGTGGSANSGS